MSTETIIEGWNGLKEHEFLGVYDFKDEPVLDGSHVYPSEKKDEFWG